MQNYRPIVLTCTLGKIKVIIIAIIALVRLYTFFVTDNTIGYLVNNNFFDKNQFGFLPYHSNTSKSLECYDG